MGETLNRNTSQEAALQPDAFNQSRGFKDAVLPVFGDDMVRPAYLAHVVLNTNDVHAMHDWYGKVLGAQTTFSLHRAKLADSSGVESMSDLDFMTFDQEHHRIAFVQRDNAPATRPINHMAFTYHSIFGLINAWRRLRGKGIKPHFTIHHGPTVSNYYIDPDGNRVELQVDVFPTRQALTSWFASGAFTPDPAGRTFDFAAMAASADAGADADYLIANDGFIADYQTSGAGAAPGRRARDQAPAAPPQPHQLGKAKLPSFPPDVPRPAYLAHVVLNTNNVPRISDWYKTVLGAQTTYAANGAERIDQTGTRVTADLDFVTFDSEHHRVAFARINTPVSDIPPLKSLSHTAYTYASIGDLITTYSRLKKFGILPVTVIHHGPTISNYYLDPDGNRVELQIDVFPTPQALTDWFNTGVFTLNPFGTYYDFDKMVERFAAGDDPDYLISNEGFIADFLAGKFQGAC